MQTAEADQYMARRQSFARAQPMAQPMFPSSNRTGKSVLSSILILAVSLPDNASSLPICDQRAVRRPRQASLIPIYFARAITQAANRPVRKAAPALRFAGEFAPAVPMCTCPGQAPDRPAVVDDAGLTPARGCAAGLHMEAVAARDSHVLDALGRVDRA